MEQDHILVYWLSISSSIIILFIYMGSACNRQKTQTVVVNIPHKQSKDFDEENQLMVSFPDTHQHSQIGMWFQF